MKRLSTAVALSHAMFDGMALLGICDKIVPGLLIGALRFGHLPAIFIPSGPMPSGMASTSPPRGRSESLARRARAEMRTAAVRRVPSVRVKSTVAGRSCSAAGALKAAMPQGCHTALRL